MRAATHRLTRKHLVASGRKKSWPLVIREHLRDRVALMDQLQPGWKVIKETFVPMTYPDKSVGLDVVFELRGGVAVRGWDITGIIDEKQP